MQTKSNTSKTILVIAGLLMCVLVTGKQAQAVWYINANGTLTEVGQVLGKDDSGGDDSHSGSSSDSHSGSSDSGSSNSGSSGSGSSGSGSSGNNSSEPTSAPVQQKSEERTEPTEAPHPTEIRRMDAIRANPTGLMRREDRVSVTPRVRISEIPRVRISEPPRRVELRETERHINNDDASKAARIRLENKGPNVKIKTEDKKREVHEVGEQPEIEIEPHQDANKIKIATSGADRLQFSRNKVGAETKFPLSVNPETNELMVDTPKGTKVVTVLPDAAVQNILMNKVIDSVDNTSSESGKTVVNLSTDGDKTVYEMRGPKNKKVFGLFPVTIQKTVTVSTDTGAIVKEDKSLTDTILDFISF